MRDLRSRLRNSTVIPALVGASLLASANVVYASNNNNVTNPTAPVNPAAVARPSSTGGTVVAAACNPCNPCAAKNPCNPCAAANACNPCAAKNPCAAANPCNPCAAANACNPCAAKNPCNPCAASNPRNPCNPCNPCAAAADAPELTPAQAIAAYNSVKAQLVAGYAKSRIGEMSGYTSWENVATSPYPAATHGGRYVNNWVNDIGAAQYRKYEDLGTMPVGSVVAKDSFTVNASGKASPGPMFLMEKMAAGFAAAGGDWRYSMVMPDGMIYGRTKGKNSAGMAFCSECHEAVAEDQDSLFLLPEENRK